MSTTQAAKHTPGPWVQPVRYSPSEASDVPMGAVEDSLGRSIAVISWPDVPTLSEVAANAKLIAAAPELLAALELVMHAANESHAPGDRGTQGRAMLLDAIQQGKAAIAKAVGQ